MFRTHTMTEQQSTASSTKSAASPAQQKVDPEGVTISGYDLAEVYGPQDIRVTAKGDPTQPDPRIGEPGEFPFTRGVHPTMYRSRLWTMRQFAGFGSADDTNARFKYLLENAKGT